MSNTLEVKCSEHCLREYSKINQKQRMWKVVKFQSYQRTVASEAAILKRHNHKEKNVHFVVEKILRVRKWRIVVPEEIFFKRKPYKEAFDSDLTSQIP